MQLRGCLGFRSSQGVWRVLWELLAWRWNSSRWMLKCLGFGGGDEVDRGLAGHGEQLQSGRNDWIGMCVRVGHGSGVLA